MATDNVQPPPYSHVVAQQSKDGSKTPLSSSSPPHYNATAPPPYSATNTSKQNIHSPSRESQGKERKESFKEVFNPETDQVREKKNNNQWKILVGVGLFVIAGAVATIVVFCCKGSAAPSPQYLLVSSSSGAGVSWPMKMGLYNLTKDLNYNGYRTYAKVTHCGQWWSGCDASSPDWEDKLDPQVIFVDKFGKWRIYMKLDPSLGGVRHPENDPTPDQPPESGWLYKPKGQDWRPDATLRVVVSDCWEDGQPDIVRPCTN